MFSKKRSTFFLAVIIVLVFLAGFLIGQGYLFKNSSFVSPGADFLLKKMGWTNLDYNLFQQVWDLAKTQYVKQPVSDQDLFYGALKGMIAGLKDPYSTFLDPELSKKFQDEMAGSFEGVGMEIGIKNNYLTVIAPLPNTPASRAGLRAGDKIYAIDKAETTNMSLEQAVSLIRGPKGTKVVLTIFREGWGKPREMEVIRDVINIITVSWEIKKDQIAYLKLSHFNETTASEFKKAAAEILKKNPRGLILDLRNNPGGYLDSAVEIAGYWLKNDLAVISRDAQAKETEYRPDGQGELSKLPTVVLINGGSASGSEILAGALQDWQKATLVGEKTFGKGSVQNLTPLSDGSALKITIAYWLTPKRRMINEIGIAPDIEIKLTEEDYNQNRDPQLDKAMELLNK